MKMDASSGTLLEKAARLELLCKDLAGLFHIGNPMPPQERLERSDALIKETRVIVAALDRFEQTSLRTRIRDLEEIIERTEEQRERFRKRMR